MNFSRNKWPILMTSLALLAVVMFGGIAYFNTTRVRAAEQEIADAFAIREATRKLLLNVVNTETGQRGFLLTGDEDFLEPYHVGLSEIDSDVEQLRALLAEEPEQLNRLDVIAKLAEQREEDLKQSVAIRSKIDAAALTYEQGRELVISRNGRKLMEQIRATHKRMLAHTEERLTWLQKRATQLASMTKGTIVLGNALAIGLAILSFIAWRKGTGRLDAANLKVTSREKELVAVTESAAEGIATFGNDLRFRYMNPAGRQILRVKNELAGRSLLNFIPSANRKHAKERLNQIFGSKLKQHRFSDSLVLRENGEQFPVEGVLQRATVDGEEILTLMFVDQSDQKQLTTLLEQQSQLFDQIRDSIHVCDMDDKIVFWNKESEKVFGISEDVAVGNNIVDLIYQSQAEHWAKLKSLLMDGKEERVVVEWNLLGKDERQIVVEHRQLLLRDWEGKPTAQLTIDFDVSDRKKFEIRAQRDRRLESIGTLAGGVAHDLNNVLSPILMASKMLKREGADYHKLADTIVMSAERCSKMIRKLLSFAGGTIEEYEKITFGEIAQETHSILLHAIPSNIELTVDSSDDLYPVFGDPTEISQILMNLAINARDAMPDGGTLDIRFENVMVDESRFERRHLLEVGDYVRISVADTGCGIQPENVDKVFDPFFTTKSQDKGTGLGLATTMGIVRSHHGEVFLHTEPGKGTTFYVYLPADTGNSQIGNDESIQRIGDMRRMGQTIMLVDDESLILETAQSALELHGYKVITAGGGAEAVATFQHQGSQIDVVILDMMMPGMDGLQTHHALRSMDPDVKVIATSGLRRLGKQGSRMTDVNGFLEKPYTDQQLFEIVATTLAEKSVSVES